MYYYNNYDFRAVDPAFVQNIAKAIDGEYSAIACYENLSQLAPNDEAKNRILEIRKDEVRHYQVFSQIYRNLTGRQPTPRITEQCATDYRVGLENAFKDEQETVDFYLDIADQTNDLYIKQQFQRASRDEQNHAVWFLYFLTH